MVSTSWFNGMESPPPMGMSIPSGSTMTHLERMRMK
jgi:hypothetical protein